MIYTVVFSGVAVTAQQDLFEVTSAATQITLIHSVMLTQSTEIGDAMEEGLSILAKSGATVSGTGGTTPTAIPRLFLGSAFAGVCDVNNTTKANTGTIVTHEAWNWNVRVPFQYIWTPETRPIISPSRRWTLELATTPADSITMSGTLTIESIG